MKTNETISVAILAIAATCAFFFMSRCSQANSANSRAQFEQCVKQGGSWINGHCIAPKQEAAR